MYYELLLTTEAVWPRLGPGKAGQPGAGRRLLYFRQRASQVKFKFKFMASLARGGEAILMITVVALPSPGPIVKRPLC